MPSKKWWWLGVIMLLVAIPGEIAFALGVLRGPWSWAPFAILQNLALIPILYYAWAANTANKARAGR